MSVLSLVYGDTVSRAFSSRSILCNLMLRNSDLGHREEAFITNGALLCSQPHLGWTMKGMCVACRHDCLASDMKRSPNVSGLDHAVGSSTTRWLVIHPLGMLHRLRRPCAL